MPSRDQNREPDSDTGSRPGTAAASPMGCGHSCEHCAVDGTDAASSSVGGPYRGLTLALLAGYFFLFPVGCAIAAAALTRSDPDLQTAVSLLSFGAAMLFTAGSVRLWARCRAKETDHG